MPYCMCCMFRFITIIIGHHHYNTSIDTGILAESRFFYFDVCTVHLVQFIIQTKKCTTHTHTHTYTYSLYYSNILYIICKILCIYMLRQLLKLWVRILPGAWKSVCCECCVLSGGGLCDGLVTRPEESYRMWCVVVCDLETSRMRRPWPTGGGGGGGGLSRQKKERRRIYFAFFGVDNKTNSSLM